MRVNPYIEPLLRNAIDLLNRPVSTPAELEVRWTAHGLPAQHPTTAADLREVDHFLDGLRRAVDATTETERVDILNAMLTRFTVGPSITDHDGSGWHLHYRDPDAGFGATLAGATSAAAAQYLTDRGMHRLHRCAAEDCANAFVDFSRPGTQRYCTHPCANRDAVRRHRAATRTR
ncbi:CGNR zinc finger domain-containing protein [Nocardia sp. NPDC003482]